MCVCVWVCGCVREREVLKGLDLHVSFYPQLLPKVELKQMAARVSGSILGRLAFFDGKRRFGDGFESRHYDSARRMLIKIYSNTFAAKI